MFSLLEKKKWASPESNLTVSHLYMPNEAQSSTRSRSSINLNKWISGRMGRCVRCSREFRRRAVGSILKALTAWHHCNFDLGQKRDSHHQCEAWPTSWTSGLRDHKPGYHVTWSWDSNLTSGFNFHLRTWEQHICSNTVCGCQRLSFQQEGRHCKYLLLPLDGKQGSGEWRVHLCKSHIDR